MILVFGGVKQRQEHVQLTVDDVKEAEAALIVKLPVTKNKKCTKQPVGD